MLICVLERRAGISAAGQDIFLNVAGGLKVQEPACDLGVIAALASSVRNQPLPEKAAFVGEVGLGGEVRSVARIDSRIAEAARLGFKTIVVPRRGITDRTPTAGARLVKADTVHDALVAVMTP
jgi:DNA repair protein RadA/Sms